MPGPRCTVCDHAQRKAIDAALSVASERSIAKQFGLNHGAVHRHKVNHVGPAVARAAARREDLSADALVQKLVGYLEDAEAMMASAKADNDRAGFARLLKEARETSVRLGQCIGLWRDKSQTYIDNRRQTLNLSGLTTDELRKLAALSP